MNNKLIGPVSMTQLTEILHAKYRIEIELWYSHYFIFKSEKMIGTRQFDNKIK
jgi:hypothetical protein